MKQIERHAKKASDQDSHQTDNTGKPDNDDRPDRKPFDEKRWCKQRERYRKKAEEAIRRQWRDKENRFNHTPWLVIRYAAGDFGLRPIPGGLPHWVSPDIRVQSSDPTGKAVAGEENFVYVRIFNIGMARAAPVKIDFYWANPALGLGAANMNLIGSEWVEIRSQFSKEVKCNTPWVPIFVNNGHECLMVNCSDPILDPISSPFLPRLDRHVGQRNVTVLQAEAGATLPFKLELNNLLPLTAQTMVFARAQHFAVAGTLQKAFGPVELTHRLAAFGRPAVTPQVMQTQLQAGTREYRNALTAARLTRSAPTNGLPDCRDIKTIDSAPSIAGAVSEARLQLLPTRSGRATADYLHHLAKMGDSHCFAHPDMFKFQEITMTPLENRQLNVELGIPHSAKAGEYVVFHLEQRTDQMMLGGYTIVIQVKR